MAHTPQVKQFTQLNAATQSSVISLAILFTALLILSNLTAFKLAHLGPFDIPAGLLFFPLTFVFNNILTEVYGFKVSRQIIWMALFANTFIFLGTWLTIYLPPSPFWQQQEAYNTVYQATLRVFIASTVSYFLGEYSNSVILAKLKITTAGKHLWLRALASTMVGVGIDTLLFIHIAFLYTMPYAKLWNIIAAMYGLKVLYEICALPLTYKISRYLKKKDEVDHYDIHTNFSPFSLKI